MKVTGWSNGSPSASGAGYGLRISAADRDRYFDRSWSEVSIELATRLDGRNGVCEC